MIIFLVVILIATIVAVLFFLNQMVEAQEAVADAAAETTFLEELWNWATGQDNNDASGGVPDEEYVEEDQVNGDEPINQDDYYAGNGDYYSDSTWA